MRDFELLNEILSLYAERYRLTVITTDSDGESVLPVKGENALSTVLLHDENDGFSGVIRKTLKEARNIKNPLVYELWPGMHTIIAPLVTEDGRTFYIWAGVMVEKDTKHLVQAQLEEKYRDIKDWPRVLADTPTLTAENKAGWLKRISKLVRLAGISRDERNGPSTYHEYNQLLSIAFQKSDMSLTKVLNKFLARGQHFDFLGIAEKHDDEKYHVTHTASEVAQDLKGAEFAVGEGFLGRVLVTGVQEHWDSIQKDPRTHFFNRNGLSPVTLFCFPITTLDGSLALFFGGNLTRKKTAGELEYAHTLATILEKSLLNDALENENTQQFQRLTALVEICKMMVSRPEYKRIIYILVDISLSLIEGPFSCMVLRDPVTGKTKLISRGAHNEHMGEYAQDVIDRYYNDSSVESTGVSLKTDEDKTRWRSPVIECPLYYKNMLLGILCVGTDSPDEPQLSEDIKFLQTLSSVGGVTLQLAQNETEDSEEKQVSTLYYAIKQFDIEAFSAAESAADIAENFAEKIGLSLWSRQTLVNSCKLYHYDSVFIREMLPGSPVAGVVEDAKLLIGRSLNWEDADVESQGLAIIFSYLNDNRPESVASLPGEKTSEVVTKFIAYINSTQMLEEDFLPAGEQPENEITESAIDAIKQLNISPREQEVLDLVIRGMNNREIGERLYISSHTVKNHVTRIFQKLGVPDRAHAISKVYQLKYQQRHTS